MQYLRISVISAGYVLALPVEIYTPRGLLVVSGAVSSRQEKCFALSLRERGQTDRRLERVYVFAKLPGGTTIEEVVELDADGGHVVLNAAKQSPYEWLEWVTPFRSLKHLGDEQVDSTTGLSLGAPRRIGKVWATLWEFQEQRWEAINVHIESIRGKRGVSQLTIDVPPRPHLLQLGGEELAWRLVSLPPGERVKIALTLSPQEAGGDALEITVGRQSSDNELVMSYLSRGAFPETSRLAELMGIADRMLYEKFDDPISAVAGGYVLLRTNKLEQREHWLSNLERHFPYIADVKILKAELARGQEGVPEKDIRQMLLDSMEIGFPIFSLGMTLLLDSMAAMHRGKDESRQFHRAYLAVQAYVRARCSKKGVYLSFYGKSPVEPLWSPIYGTEQAGAATPVSQGSSPPVFMRRPKGSPRSVRYGATSVTLPSAPVSGHMLEISHEPFEISQRITIVDPWLSLADLPQPVREQARIKVDPVIPSVEIQSLPEYLAAKETDSGSIRQSLRDTLSEIRLVFPVLESLEGPIAKRRPKQNAQYWKTARVSHSISVMDEDE